jgi:hypothetical protein
MHVLRRLFCCGQRADPDYFICEVGIEIDRGIVMLDFWNDAEWDKVLRHRKQAYREGIRDGVVIGVVLTVTFAYVWCYFGVGK